MKENEDWDVSLNIVLGYFFSFAIKWRCRAILFSQEWNWSMDIAVNALQLWYVSAAYWVVKCLFRSQLFLFVMSMWYAGYTLSPALLIHPFPMPTFSITVPLRSWPIDSTMLESVFLLGDISLPKGEEPMFSVWHSAYYSDSFQSSLLVLPGMRLDLRSYWVFGLHFTLGKNNAEAHMSVIWLREGYLTRVE